MEAKATNFYQLSLEYLQKIKRGLICPYCGNPSELKENGAVYGSTTSKIYLCEPCKAYVGVHEGTDNALGRLANRELRKAKIQAHQFFDIIAREGLIRKVPPEFVTSRNLRQKAYAWLAGKMGIKEAECHIGMFGIDECNQVIDICKQALISIEYKNLPIIPDDDNALF